MFVRTTIENERPIGVITDRMKILHLFGEGDFLIEVPDTANIGTCEKLSATDPAVLTRIQWWILHPGDEPEWQDVANG